MIEHALRFLPKQLERLEVTSEIIVVEWPPK